MIDKRLVRDMDWLLLALVLFISAAGVLFIHSASHLLAGGHAVRQAVFVFISLGALFLLVAVDYKVLLTYGIYLYGALVLVLAGLLAFARLVAGTKSWITLGVFRLQPSELMKIALILVLARLFAEYKPRHVSGHAAAAAVAAAGAPMALIVLQPDLGTALTFVPILGGALLLAGLRRKAVVILLLAAIGLALVGWNFVLRDYQKQRLTTLVNPGLDTRGAGYQILQSKIAIGSGGLAGKGFMKGSQSQLRFLPARHTDFIFSVVGEEFGFAGVFVVMLAYILLLARLFLSVGKSRDRAGVYIVFLASSLIAFEFLVNVLMIIGLFPVTGVPLPFLSYGGSSLLSNFLAVGLVLNVSMRRFVNV